MTQQCPVEIRCSERQQCNDPGLCEAAVACEPGVAVVCSAEQQVQVACDPAGPYAVGGHSVLVSASTPSQQLETTCPLEVRDCEPPSCQAPPELVLECSAACGVPEDDPELQAWLDGFSADDNCGVDSTRLLLPSRLPAGCGQGERSEVAYLARDAVGYHAVCSSAVSVVDTLPPSIECPPPLTVDCSEPGGVAADEPVIQAWLASASAEDLCGPVLLSHDAPALLPSGCGAGETTSVTFTATDDCGNTASCSSQITVVDPPPLLESCGDGSVCLWPPNHKYVCFEEFSAQLAVTDACGSGSVELAIECESNQCDDAPCPEYPGQNGDGNTSDDCWYDPVNDVLCVRSERAGSEPEGRVYSVSVVASDDCGESAPQTVFTVYVPHDQSQHDPCLAPPPQAPR